MDGRELDPQWFIESSKHYNPKTYQALIWYEHFRWRNFGEVHAMKFEKQDDGSVKQYNRLVPSDELLELNRAGQKLFTSVEIIRNFAQRGHAYQIGLGITDSPASLSTDKLKFNALQANDDFQQLCNGVLCERIDKYKQRVTGFKPEEIEIFIGEEITDLEFVTERKVFDLGAFLFRKKSDESPENHNQPEAIDMDKDELKQLFSTVIEEKMQPFSDLKERVEKLEQANQEEPPKENEKEEFSLDKALADQFKKMNEHMEEQTKQFKELADKIDNTELDGQERPPATGGEKDDQFSIDY